MRAGTSLFTAGLELGNASAPLHFWRSLVEATRVDIDALAIGPAGYSREFYASELS
jgi:hypothetical protein